MARRSADIYYDAPPVKELRKKFKLKKLPGIKPLLGAVLKAYKESGGKNKRPNIAVVEIRQSHASPESTLLAEFFSREGCPTEVVSPDQLEYRNNVLRRGEFAIDVVYRNVTLQEFLVRFDLNHPLVRAYKERAVCMINSFRTELPRSRPFSICLPTTPSPPSSRRRSAKPSRNSCPGLAWFKPPRPRIRAIRWTCRIS